MSGRFQMDRRRARRRRKLRQAAIERLKNGNFIFAERNVTLIAGPGQPETRPEWQARPDGLYFDKPRVRIG